MIPSVPPELIDQIPSYVNLENAKSIISFLATLDVGSRSYEFLKEQVRRISEKNKFGFSPDKKLSLELSEVESTGIFEELQNCVGEDYYCIQLFIVGIHIQGLNKEGQRKIVDKLREDIYKKFKKPGLQVLEIASTGALPSIVKYLTDLKINKNYSKDELVEELDTIINKWKDITIFVTNEDTVSNAEDEIISKMIKERELFFVFGIGNAGMNAAKAIALLYKDGVELIRKNKYWFPVEVCRYNQPDGTPMLSWKFTRKIK